MTQIEPEVIDLAKEGDGAALSALATCVQDRVHRLAMRMLPIPEAAEDATQEILILVVTRLSTFEGRSSFETWVYRIAMNYLLTAKKQIDREPNFTFDWFAQDLEAGLVDDAQPTAEDRVMLNDLRIRCTMAMLVCLDRNLRAAYVLGEILEFDQSEACEVLEIGRDLFRKRLSRARAEVQAFTARSCGLANDQARCRCPRRLPEAVRLGRVDTGVGNAFPDAPDWEDVRDSAARTEASLVAARLQRATGELRAPPDLAAHVLSIVIPSG